MLPTDISFELPAVTVTMRFPGQQPAVQTRHQRVLLRNEEDLVALKRALPDILTRIEGLLFSRSFEEFCSFVEDSRLRYRI